MLAIHVPTLIWRVATPMSWAVAITSLLTSAAKIASNPASSASRAIVCTSLALQPTPGTTARASRSAIFLLLLGSTERFGLSYRLREWRTRSGDVNRRPPLNKLPAMALRWRHPRSRFEPPESLVLCNRRRRRTIDIDRTDRAVPLAGEINASHHRQARTGPAVNALRPRYESTPHHRGHRRRPLGSHGMAQTGRRPARPRPFQPGRNILHPRRDL